MNDGAGLAAENRQFVLRVFYLRREYILLGRRRDPFAGFLERLLRLRNQSHENGSESRRSTTQLCRFLEKPCRGLDLQQRGSRHFRLGRMCDYRGQHDRPAECMGPQDPKAGDLVRE